MKFKASVCALIIAGTVGCASDKVPAGSGNQSSNSTVQNPPPTNSGSGGGGPVAVNDSICKAYPGGYKSLFDFSFGASILAHFDQFYVMTSNSNGFVPMASVRLRWDQPRPTNQMGAILAAESPAVAAVTYKFMTISDVPCDLTGSSVVWKAEGASPKIVFTVEAQEGFIFGTGQYSTFKQGIRLAAGNTYYLNISTGEKDLPMGTSCPANTNCGVVLDINQPQ